MSQLSAVPACLAALTLLAAAPFERAVAQHSSDALASHLQSTRPELQARLAELRTSLEQHQKSDRVVAETLTIARRLEAGDFRSGDHILVAVEDQLPLGATADRPAPVGKSLEQQLSDTFSVGEGVDLVLPGVGQVPLHGVLRSELQTYLAGVISRSIRDPVVHAWPLITLGVTGEVAKPGFYAMPPNAGLTTLLNAAGGPTKDARMDKLKIERDGHSIWKGKDLRRAIEQGRTLDQLALLPGDMLEVPVKHSLDNLYRPLQFVAVLGTITVAYFTIRHELGY